MIVTTGTQAAKAHLSLGAGLEPLLTLNDLMSGVEIDSHKIDANFVVGINNAEGLKTFIVLKRLNVLALVERASTAVLWYLVVYSPEVSALDVVRLITESIRAVLPKPENNLLGLNLDEDAGFPGEKIPAMKHALPDVLMPDNALANLANAVSHELRKELGFSICYGAPGHFEIRPNVERTFKNLTASIFQRFPNTTGSKPSDNPGGAKLAIKYEMEADVLEELVCFHFARHNITMSEGISFLTPMEYIRQKLELANGNFMPRTLLFHKIDKLTHYRTTKKVKVKCYPDRGVKPFIQLDRVRYSNDILRASPWLKDVEIIIHIDEQDMRIVQAFLMTGESLGILKASGLWGRTKHGRKTRQAINKLCAMKLLQFFESDDPVQKYMEYIAAQSLKTQPGSTSTKHNSTLGTELNRVRAEINDEEKVFEYAQTDDYFDSPKERFVKQVCSSQLPTGQHNSLMPSTMLDLKKLLNRP
jgi:hypothetical protein